MEGCDEFYRLDAGRMIPRIGEPDPQNWGCRRRRRHSHEAPCVAADLLQLTLFADDDAPELYWRLRSRHIHGAILNRLKTVARIEMSGRIIGPHV
jgi:hypothetical protein